MSAVVDDSSAVIAWLLLEPGHEKIGPYLSTAIISTVNYQEVAKNLIMMGMDLASVREALDLAKLDIRPHEIDDAFQAALLAPATRRYGSGLGDRSCMALAIKLGVPALTTDRAWAQLEIAGLQVILAR